MLTATLGKLAIRGARVMIDRDAMSSSTRIRVVLAIVDRHGTGENEVVLQENVMDDKFERMTSAQRASHIRNVCIRAFTHEIDEWLQVDGEQVRDPHPETSAKLPRPA